MKKSMLHRSFNSSKCKTSLKLAVSRIKLLKNKRNAHVKQLKRELAQLLESGQDRTARIRVEHVVTEEKIITAYDLIEIYCEIIVARLPVIESQKNCPIDLKEAIASVIYASPRCADLPELMDARKHLKAKYGTEFVSAALELRPDCGVSRMLVEKLSAKAPDGPTKIKILRGIAEEHNINWDPESLEDEFKPPDDLLNGPNTFEKSTKMHVEPPEVKTQPDLDEKGPPNNRMPPAQHIQHDTYSSFHQQSSGFSPGSQNFAPNVDAYKTMHQTSHPEVGHSGTSVEEREFTNSYSGVGRDPSMPVHNWNMEFKDATAAAQAAAESAERASMAARAAAELSSRGQNPSQYSMDSQLSSTNIRRDEVPQEYVSRKFQDDRSSGLPSRSQSSKDSQRSSSDFRKDSQKLRDEHPSDLSDHEQTNNQYSMYSQHPSSDIRHDEGRQEYVRQKLQDEHPSVLSSYGQTIRQYSMNPPRPSSDIEKDEVTQNHVSQKIQDKHPSEVLGNQNFHNNRNFVMPYEYSDEDEQDNCARGTRGSYNDGSEANHEPSASASRKYRSSTIGDSLTMNTFPMNDNYAQNNSFRPEEREYMTGMQYETDPEDNNAHIKQGIEKQPNRVSSGFHPSVFSNDPEVVVPENQKMGNYYGSSPFVFNDKEKYEERASDKEAYDKKSIAFDDSGSDNDSNYMDDMMGDHKEQHSNVPFSTPVRTTSYISENKISGVTRQSVNDSPTNSISGSHFAMNKHSSPMFSEGLTSAATHSPPDDMPAATYDSDGPSIESEEELHRSKLSGSRSRKSSLTGESHGSRRTLSVEENARSIRRQQFQSSSSGSDYSDEEPHKTKLSGSGKGSQTGEGRGSSRTSLVEEENARSKSRQQLHANEVDAVSFNSPIRYNEQVQDSTLESGKELNFGALMGGLKNKVYRRPPYVRDTFDGSKDKQPAQDTSADNEPSSYLPAVRRADISGATDEDTYDQRDKFISKEDTYSYEWKARLMSNEKTSSKNRVTDPVSSDDTSDEDVVQQTSNIRRQSNIPKVQTEGKEKSSPKARISFFDSDSDDSAGDLPKRNLTSKAHLTPAFSRRTKASPSTSDRSPSKAMPEASASSKAPGSLSRPQTRFKSSHYQGKGEKPSFAEQAASKPMPKTESSKIDGLTPSGKEQSGSTIPNTASGSFEGSSTSISSEKSLSKDNSTASHVHPKLPDYDTLAARLMALRTNRS